MKKGIIVLLITVLAAGMAFAAFTGYAETKFSFNFDNKTYGFNDEDTNRTYVKADFTFTHKFDGDKKVEITGDTTPYAELSASLALTASTKVTVDGYHAYKGSKSNTGNINYKIEAKITKANIIGEKWSLDLLHAAIGTDWAVAGIDKRYLAADKKYYGLTYVYNYQQVDGVTLTLNDWATVGIGVFDGDIENEKLKLAITAISAEGLLERLAGITDITAQVAGTFTSIDGDKAAGASVKAAYKPEGKIEATFASDFGYDNEKFDFDADATAKYTEEEWNVGAEVYYATDAQARKGATLVGNREFNYLGIEVKGEYTPYADVTVQAFDLLDDPDSVPAAVRVDGRKELNVIAHTAYFAEHDITVAAKDLMNDTRDIDFDATVTKIENLELTIYGHDLINRQDLGFDASYKVNEELTAIAGAEYVIDDGYTGIYGGATYTAEKFVATGKVCFEKADADADATLGLYAKISSKVLVQNAELSLTYATLTNAGWTTTNFLGDAPVYGSLVAACKVAF